MIVVAVIWPELVDMMALWLLVPAGYALQPTYYYLAIERNFPLALLIVFSRMGAVIWAYVGIGENFAGTTLPALFGCMTFGAGVASLLYAVKKFDMGGIQFNTKWALKLIVRGKKVSLATCQWPFSLTKKLPFITSIRRNKCIDEQKVAMCCRLVALGSIFSPKIMRQSQCTKTQL